MFKTEEALAIIGGHVDEELLLRNEYLAIENEILRKKISGRIKLSQRERMRLATIGKKIGIKALREVAMIVKPETIITWYRKLIAAKFDSSKRRKKKVGRPLTDCELETLILQISKRNPRWGYDRIAGALANLGYRISDQTVGNILKRNSLNRGSSEAMSMVSLIEVVQACASLVKPKFSRSIQLEIEVDHTLSVMGRRSELIQVLLNLLINAAQAMPKNRLSGHWIKVTSSMMESGEIQLIVSDNAQGIPTDDLDHIFEPFFSSKPVGEGSGLGLAVSHGIIEAHQATISVSSVEGEGTTFTLTFSGGQSLTNSEDISKNLLESSQENLLLEEPGLARDAEVEESQALMSSISIAKRRILVVDDDVLVAKSLAKMLRQDIVVTSSSGAQALQILATSRFDLILSDVMMPVMDGPTFYQEVILRLPRYKERFIFVTGAAKNSEVAKAIHETERLILSKPITKQRLLNAVNKVLTTIA